MISQNVNVRYFRGRILNIYCMKSIARYGKMIY